MSLIRVSNLSKIEIQRCLDLNPDGIHTKFHRMMRLNLQSHVHIIVQRVKGLSPHQHLITIKNSDIEKLTKNFCWPLIEGLNGLKDLEKFVLNFTKYL